MHKSLGFVVMSYVLALAGCALGGGDPPAEPSADYGFIRGTDGQAIQSNVSALDANPVQGFDHSLTGGVEQLTAAPQDCSGVCDANTCLCSGDFNCCVVGCGLCFILVAN